MNSSTRDLTLEASVQSQPRDWVAVAIMRDGVEALLCMDVNLARLLERCIPMIHLRRTECVYSPEEILDIRSIVTRRRMYGRWEDATYEHFRLSDAKRLARIEMKRRAKMIENNCTLASVS